MKRQQAKAKPNWKIHAYYLDACNCDWGYPCQFNAKPTHGNCEGLSGIHIIDGNYGSNDIRDLIWHSLVLGLDQYMKDMGKHPTTSIIALTIDSLMHYKNYYGEAVAVVSLHYFLVLQKNMTNLKERVSDLKQRVSGVM